MKKLALVVLVLCFKAAPLHADALVWDLPGGIGKIGLPFQSTEVIPVGCDGVLKQVITGASLPVLNIKNTVFGQVGAVGVFGSQSLNAQPYLGLGMDILRYIPVLAQYKSLHLNGFGRWATDQGKLGAGVSISYSFKGGTDTP